MAYTLHNFLPQPFVSNNPGIYAIVNRDNGKLYIGSAAVLSHRWSAHRHDFFRNRQNPYFTRAFRKNPEAFYFELIEELPGATKYERLAREQFWMDFYKSYIPSSGYNACLKASSCEGVKHGPEFSATLSQRFKGKKWSEETKAHWRMVRKTPRGWKWTDEQKTAHSKRMSGGSWSDNQREKYNAWLESKPTHWNKRVAQLSMAGDLVREFDSIKDAESHLGKRSNIHSVCKGKRPHCLGFKWKYV